MTLWQGSPQTTARKPSTSAPAEPSAELAAIYARVETGIAWLVEHDPTGAFNLWFESGLMPLSPMPAQPELRREEWSAYHGARSLFEQLWRKMVALERKESPR